MELLILVSLIAVTYTAWILIDRRRTKRHEEAVSHIKNIVDNVSERRTQVSAGKMLDPFIHEKAASKDKLVDPVRTKTNVPHWKQKRDQDKQKAVSSQQRAPRARTREAVKRLERMRDRYQNAGDTRQVTIINQHIQEANDPFVTMMQIEMLESLLNGSNQGVTYSQPQAYAQDSYSGSGGDFGGGGATGGWPSSTRDNS